MAQALCQAFQNSVCSTKGLKLGSCTVKGVLGGFFALGAGYFSSGLIRRSLNTQKEVVKTRCINDYIQYAKEINSKNYFGAVHYLRKLKKCNQQVAK